MQTGEVEQRLPDIGVEAVVALLGHVGGLQAGVTDANWKPDDNHDNVDDASSCFKPGTAVQTQSELIEPPQVPPTHREVVISVS